MLLRCELNEQTKLAFNFTHVWLTFYRNLFASSKDLEVIFGHLVDAKFEPALHPSAMNEHTRVQVEALFQRYRMVSQLLQMALSCLYLHDDVTDTAEQHVSRELNYQLAQSAFPLRALVTECHQGLGRIRHELCQVLLWQQEY